MIAARGGMLLVASLACLAAFGAMSAQVPASLLRLDVTIVVGLLAPLFWPGQGATLARTALRVLAWSAAAAAMAAIVIALLGDPSQSWGRIVLACALLMAMLVPTHAVVAALERAWTARSHDADSARELAGRTVACVLALLGASPLWLGPTAELLSARDPRAIDLLLAASPVTHLAVASGNDLLRNAWLYGHSNLAALQVSYPELATIAWVYGVACVALALLVLGLHLQNRRFEAGRGGMSSATPSPRGR